MLSPIRAQDSSPKAFKFRGEWVEQLLQVKKGRGVPVHDIPEDDTISTPSLSPPNSKTSTATHTPYNASSLRSRIFPPPFESSALSQTPNGSIFTNVCQRNFNSIEPKYANRPPTSATPHNGVDTPPDFPGHTSKRPNGHDPLVNDHSTKRPRLLSPSASGHMPSSPLPKKAATAEGRTHSATSETATQSADEDTGLEDLEEGYSFWEILQGSCEDQFARGVRVPLAPILRIRGMPMLQMPKPQRLVAINYALYERDTDASIPTLETAAGFNKTKT